MLFAVALARSEGEYNGLAMTAVCLHQANSDALFVVSMRRIHRRTAWLINPTEKVQIEFYDEKGRYYGFVTTDIRLGERFASGQSEYSGFLAVRARAPVQATYAYILFGVSGLGTKRVPIR